MDCLQKGYKHGFNQPCDCETTPKVTMYNYFETHWKVKENDEEYEEFFIRRTKRREEEHELLCEKKRKERAAAL